MIWFFFFFCLYPFFEAYMIQTHVVSLKTVSSLKGLQILHLSDLHISEKTSWFFLKKAVRKIKALEPEIICITGDFLLNSQCCEPKLSFFLQHLHCSLGVYAVLGNHDHTSYVSLSRKTGSYEQNPTHRFKDIFFSILKKKKISKPSFQNLDPHPQLISLFKKYNITLLNNTSLEFEKFTLVGLGDYTCGQMDPDQAFKDVKKNKPVIVMLHNPDGASDLSSKFDLMLCGHTHGHQIYFPKPFFWVSLRLTFCEDDTKTRGLYNDQLYKMYISRGLGSHPKIRLFSIPEITLLRCQ